LLCEWWLTRDVASYSEKKLMTAHKIYYGLFVGWGRPNRYGFNSRNRVRFGVERNDGLFAGWRRREILEKEIERSYRIITYHAELGNESAIMWHLERIRHLKSIAKRNGWLITRKKYGR